MRNIYSFIGFFFLLPACDTKEAEIKSVARVADRAWIDTVRFNNSLTSEQRKQVYYKRNFEEDYKQIKDTTRVALRFFWYRSFHPYTVIRLENRPRSEVDDSTKKLTTYSEWFAINKVDIPQLNRDCPVRRNGKCYGGLLPFVWQQNVNVLPPNKTPVVIAALDSIDFWHMKAEYLSRPHTDGSSWTLQVYYHGKYHEVSTDMDKHPIKLICLRMLKLSGYKPKPEEIY